MNPTYDWLVVGAGFTGAVVAERLAAAGKRVLIIDRRDHVAGNAWDPLDAHGIRIHAHGPHIFHTNAERVVAYLSQFTAWRPYEHRVRAQIDGQLVPVPFNLTTLKLLRGEAEATRIERLLREAFAQEHVPILTLMEHAHPDLRRLGQFAYDTLLAGYTAKQWERRPEDLDPSVTGRVPFRISHDDRYFQDTFQQMPRDGFGALFERMLANPLIDVQTGVALSDVRGMAPKIVYTGPLDAWFGQVHGALPYRSIRFEARMLALPQHHPVAVVNYPDFQTPWTRETEFKHLTGQRHPVTTLFREFPEAYVPGVNEPYYPIPGEETRERARRYTEMANREAPHVFFAGRLADYQYYNMDQAVGRALSLFEKRLRPLL